MRSREHAELLLRKAAQDEFTVEKLVPDPAAPDVIGFHAQQAVEKLVKAVLARAAVHYRRTHDLTELIDLLRDNGEPFPDELDDVRGLTPFATSFRYDDVPVEDEASFDRLWALDSVRQVRTWAEAALRRRSNEPLS